MDGFWWGVAAGVAGTFIVSIVAGLIFGAALGNDRE